MRKGEEKRREMLVVAERLFCLKGYDATSIQDILDVLQISKGGFYHYFASKEALLESIFLTRAEHAVALAESSVIAIADPMDRLNGVLAFFMPLRKDDAPAPDGAAGGTGSAPVLSGNPGGRLPAADGARNRRRLRRRYFAAAH